MRLEQGTAYPEGRMTLEEAGRLLREGEAAVHAGCQAFDFSGAGQVDSSALSLMLSWQRAAAAQGRSLRFMNVPVSLHSLIQLYGIGELLQA